MGRNISADQTAPARTWSDVTPSNITVLPAGVRGLYVGGTGDLRLQGYDGVGCTFIGVPAGTFVPCAPHKVLAATTATLIVALY